MRVGVLWILMARSEGRRGLIGAKSRYNARE